MDNCNMCGIVGAINPDGNQSELKSRIERSVSLLNHRGPDQSGYLIESGVAFGISRLAIRDKEQGRQPMSLPNGSFIVFNGELYNLEWLHRRIEQSGYQLCSYSDTEVLLVGLDLYGERLVEQLTGMFAFAFWDFPQRKLILARDHWGEKPLYITIRENKLIFASEIKAFCPWPEVDWTVDYQDLVTFVRHGYVPGARTGWKGIKKLLPGEMLVWKDGIIRSKIYNPLLRPKALFTKRENSLEAEAEQLQNLLRKAVKDRLVSDQPVGAFLSGGIDSSSVVAMMSDYLVALKTFSVAWAEQDYSEEKYSQLVAKQYGIEHFIVRCTPQYFQEKFDALVGHFDEPFGDESLVPTALISEFAKQHVDVVLTGDGADEFFGGYERYRNSMNTLQYIDVFAASPKHVMAKIIVREQLDIGLCDQFHLDLLNGTEQYGTLFQRRWIDISTYLPSQILTKVDRMTMRVGLEARSPFLDTAITKWALNCASPLLVKGRCSKRVLRKSMNGILPEPILNRDKQGFGVPLVYWFRNELFDWLEEQLWDGPLRKTDFIDFQGVASLFREHVSGRTNYYRPLLNLVALSGWIKNKDH